MEKTNKLFTTTEKVQITKTMKINEQLYTVGFIANENTIGSFAALFSFEMKSCWNGNVFRLMF